MARRLKSIKDSKKIDLKTSFLVLANIPRFIREIYQSSTVTFLVNLLARLTTAFSPIVILWVAKLIIDEIIQLQATGATDYSTLWNYVILEFVIVIVSDLLNRLINLTDGLIGDLYSNHSSVKIIQKTNELDISQLEDSAFYDKLERARTQTSSRVNLMSNTLSQIQDIIVIASLIIGLIYFEPWLIVLITISIIPSFLNEIKFSSSRYSIARSWTAERRELDYLRYIGANYKTIKEVKLFGLTDYIADRFKKLSDLYYQINKNLAIRRTGFGALYNVLGVLSYYGAYALIIYRTVSGVITVGELTFLSGSFQRLRSRLQASFSRFTRISESALYLKDYFDFIDFKVPIFYKSHVRLPENIQKGFEFKNVRFRYPGSSEDVIRSVNFRVHAGEKIAFVGKNGAGKTTLIKLLMRFYEPNEGEILLDGININRFDKAEYQKMFGVIFQDFIRYEFTVKENIAVGDIEKLNDLEAIETASERSLASEVIEQMKEGLNQQLGKRFARGSDLSGGQWQKIALARAYMKDANVMILDEPTSALDARAEYEAFERFMGLTKGKTSIIISHRFSTVRQADRIIVLKDGTVLEQGSHERLLDNDDLYAELFQLQAAGYH